MFYAEPEGRGEVAIRRQEVLLSNYSAGAHIFCNFILESYNSYYSWPPLLVQTSN
jgi:hypothetical protein